MMCPLWIQILAVGGAAALALAASVLFAKLIIWAGEL